MKKTKHKGRGEIKSTQNTALSAALGAVGALGTTLVLLGLCALLISTGLVPEDGMGPAVLVSCGFGSLLGGILAARGGGGHALFLGLATGLSTAGTLALCGLLVWGALVPLRCVSVTASCLCGGGLAGMLGSKGNARGRRSRR